jgi:ATP-binding cassette subfamily B multidrug efflux pump
MSDGNRQQRPADAAGSAMGRGPMRGPMGGRGRGPMGGHGMGMPVEKPKDFKKTFRRLMGYLKPRIPQFIIVFVMAIGGTVFAIFAPKILGQATTELFKGFYMKMMHVAGAKVDFEKILVILAKVAAMYLGSFAFGYLQQFIMAGVAQKTAYDMRRDVADKLTRLPLSFFDSRTHGEIMSRVTNDLDNVASTLQQSLTQLISSVVTIIGVPIMMLTISPLLTLISVLVLPLSFVMTRVIMPRSQKHFTAQWKHMGELNGHVEEMFGGHTIVKAFGHERKSIEKFNDLNGKLYNASWRAQFISGLLFPLMNFISNLGYVAVCVMGGVLVTRKAIAIGDVQAFIQYSQMFTQPIAQTANIANVLQSTVASAERVFELLDEKEEIPDSAGATALVSPRGEVAFHGVSFRYKEEAPLIDEMNINVKEGQTIAIVGPTGAGKTTLVNLLMRFYELRGGAITVDGIDIRNVKRGNLRRTFGMVLQDTWLFNGTIRDNIAYGRAGATEEEIMRAAKAAHADHFIRTLPEGYDTVLNEEASNISQGQKQLLTIARAILADPAILILDEATSSVDTRTEVQIQKAMLGLMKGRTSFVIAHRLSTIRDAELILVMNNGHIVETGNHKELLAKGGFYAEMYNAQFTGKDLVEEAVS